MMHRPTSRAVHHIALLALAIVLGVILRMPVSEEIRTADELIARDVVGTMHERGDLNTDWARSHPPLPHDFGKFRYNFSSYLIFSCIIIPKTADSKLRLKLLRNVNLIYFVVTLLAVYACLVQFQFGYTTRELSIVALAISPTLVHDSIIARPEAFITTIVSMYIFSCLAMRKRYLPGSCIAGFFLGIMVSCKFTLISLSVLYLAIVWKNRASNRVEFYLALLLFFIFSSLGAFIGAPYAFLDISGYLDGIHSLKEQYYSAHPPHSNIDGGSTFATQLAFYTMTYWLVFLAPAVQIGLCTYSKEYKNTATVLAFVAALYFAILVSASVFFERNLSPFLPAFIICFGFLLERSRSEPKYIALFASSLVVMAYWSITIRTVQSEAYGYEASATEFALIQKTRPLNFERVSLAQPKIKCGLVRQTDFSDDYSTALRSSWQENGWLLIGVLRSPFYFLPTSTLHTYLAPSYYWYHKTCTNNQPS